MTYEAKSLLKLPVFHLGSMVPSLAKARYNKDILMLEICHLYIKNISKNIMSLDPKFLKVFIERVYSFDFVHSEKAIDFHEDVRKLI